MPIASIYVMLSSLLRFCSQISCFSQAVRGRSHAVWCSISMCLRLVRLRFLLTDFVFFSLFLVKSYGGITMSPVVNSLESCRDWFIYFDFVRIDFVRWGVCRCNIHGIWVLFSSVRRAVRPVVLFAAHRSSLPLPQYAEYFNLCSLHCFNWCSLHCFLTVTSLSRAQLSRTRQLYRPDCQPDICCDQCPT